jgi:ATP-dependent Clp protease ATP-binding subunit ClpC
MTSNIGSRQIKDFGQGVGFGTKSREEGADDPPKSIIENALKKAFAPEFLNRVDDVVLFNSLKKEHINEIIDIELAAVYGRIRGLGYNIELTQEAKDFVSDKGYDEQFGARPLKRAIQKYLEDAIAEEIIQNKLEEGDTVMIDVQKEDDEEQISLSIVKATKAIAAPKEEKPSDSEDKKEE